MSFDRATPTITLSKIAKCIVTRFNESRLASKQKINHVTKAALMHVGSGQGEEDIITTFPLDPNLGGEKLQERAEEIGHEAWSLSTDHVATCSTSQTYEVITYTAEDEPYGKHRFLRYPPARSVEGGSSEPATSTGLTQMAMRFADSKERLFVDTLMKTQDRLEKENEAQRNYIEGLQKRLSDWEDRHIRNVQLREDLLDRKDERDSARKERERMSTYADRFFGHVETLLPSIVEKYTGVSASAGAIGLVRNFLKSLDDDQKTKFFGMMKPEQLGMLKNVSDYAASQEIPKVVHAPNANGAGSE